MSLEDEAARAAVAAFSAVTIRDPDRLKSRLYTIFSVSKLFPSESRKIWAGQSELRRSNAQGLRWAAAFAENASDDISLPLKFPPGFDQSKEDATPFVAAAEAEAERQRQRISDAVALLRELAESEDQFAEGIARKVRQITPATKDNPGRDKVISEMFAAFCAAIGRDPNRVRVGATNTRNEIGAAFVDGVIAAFAVLYDGTDDAEISERNISEILKRLKNQ